MEYFTKQNSIVRQIWGSSDTIMFIFAGAAAEFALNKSVDWLYFTGKLPSDPIARFLSTVSYARDIVFAEQEDALRSIDKMAAIHKAVEVKRGMDIPDWAYRDVLFMLIDYSIRSYELLERPLSIVEKQEVFEVFHRVGSRMGIRGLPQDFGVWQWIREAQLEQNLQYSNYTADLFGQYRRHLGFLRYAILIESQKLVIPKCVSSRVGFSNFKTLKPFIGIYKLGRQFNLDWLLKELLLPGAYKKAIMRLDVGIEKRGCPFQKQQLEPLRM
ncbi:oxygenase MpaB family protein [Flavobacterium pallidum]|uniref:DUF2236 domain-containing protein n=1 Tax=Flavobacterium pallidum TaxID=2172098 RepID=A0A2S1SIL9_9FLAO|nr:oxygenase MpaB family protein [Flavobacterium pallidum]AWI26264.1 DUF2236 domain-containing protein [Flavobacterium pallidum]